MQLAVCRTDGDDALYALTDDGEAYEYVVMKDNTCRWQPLSSLTAENILEDEEGDDEDEDEEDEG